MMNSLVPFTRFNDMVDSLLSPSCGAYAHDGEAVGFARANILENDNEFVVRMDLPGVKREDLEIDIENNTLKIAAKRESADEEGFKSLRSEVPGRMTYRRSFTLGRGVDRDKIKAVLRDGVLAITLAKSETALPRRIEIE